MPLQCYSEPMSDPTYSFEQVQELIIGSAMTDLEISKKTGVSITTINKIRIGRKNGQKQQTLRAILMGLGQEVSVPENVGSDDLPVRQPKLDLHINPAQVESNLKGTAQLVPTARGYELRRRDKGKQEVFLPVHGFVWLSEPEISIIDHPVFQRLRRIKQLGMAHTVYPGAVHNRFEHVLGVLHVSKLITRSLEENRERADQKEVLKDPNESCHWGANLTFKEKELIPLAALLHDIGHLPFGHSIEDELGLLNHHDKETRLRYVIEKFKSSEFQREPLSTLINEKYPHFHGRLESIGAEFSPVDLVISIILHEPVAKHWNAYAAKLQTAEHIGGQNHRILVKSEDIVKNFAADLVKNEIRLQVCADIVGNTICADLLDYLHRDWHHVGKGQYLEDRAFQYMEIRNPPRNWRDSEVNPLNPEDRFVMNLGRYPRLRTDCVSLILTLLENRYNLAEAVLFHRAKLKQTAMLERCLSLSFEVPELQNGEPSNPKLEQDLLMMSEDSFLDELCKNKPKFDMKKQSDAVNEQRVFLANSIRDRQLFRHVHTMSYGEIRPEAVMRFQQVYSENDDSARNREAALRQLEADFGLKTGELVMYCPKAKMNSKIAQVSVLVGGEIHRLDDYDNKSNPKLAAGHLAAQIERFRNLWQVTFLVDPRVQVRASLNKEEFKKWRELLAEYIQYFVIGTSQGMDIVRARSSVVERMMHSDLFQKVHEPRNWNFMVKDSPILSAAKAEENPFENAATAGGAAGRYPNGAESFWHYCELVQDEHT